MKKLKFHPNTNGGRTLQHALDLLAQYPKENRFLSMTILKGLGLDVDFVSMSKIKVEEGSETVGNLESPFISVYL